MNKNFAIVATYLIMCLSILAIYYMYARRTPNITTSTARIDFFKPFENRYLDSKPIINNKKLAIENKKEEILKQLIKNYDMNITLKDEKIDIKLSKKIAEEPAVIDTETFIVDDNFDLEAYVNNKLDINNTESDTFV